MSDEDLGWRLVAQAFAWLEQGRAPRLPCSGATRPRTPLTPTVPGADSLPLANAKIPAFVSEAVEFLDGESIAIAGHVLPQKPPVIPVDNHRSVRLDTDGLDFHACFFHGARDGILGKGYCVFFVEVED